MTCLQPPNLRNETRGAPLTMAVKIYRLAPSGEGRNRLEAVNRRYMATACCRQQRIKWL